MRHYRSRAYAAILVLWLIVISALPPSARAEDTSNQPVGLIGWVLTFDFDPNNATRLAGQFHFLFKYQDSPADYDLAGSVSIICMPNQLAASLHHCAIPDMAALIFEASQGRINIRQMQLPLGTLEVCGHMLAAGNPANVAIITTGSSNLYALRLDGQRLVLSHAQRETKSSPTSAVGYFHLELPDTTLTAPEAYTLTFDHMPELYTLDALTIIDPGAFAHLWKECSAY